MTISFLDKINLIFDAYRSVSLMPPRKKINALLCPVESTRYVEIPYILKFIKENPDLSLKKVLDVSSPYIFAYILVSKHGCDVLKTDINENEKTYIKDSEKLRFQKEDGTRLSFAENSFDFVYSISVIEHIYGKFAEAFKEMVRVCRPGGIIYLSFPIAIEHVEEWITDDIYSDQHKQNGNFFFQYRFNQNDIKNILDSTQNVEVLRQDYFVEKAAGTYDRMTASMRRRPKNKYLEHLKMAFLNVWYGFFLFSSKSAQEYPKKGEFGNISIILKKI